MHIQIHKPHAAARPGWARQLVLRQLEGLTSGGMIVEDPWEELAFGAADTAPRLVVHSPDFYSRILVGGSVGAGESYAEGLWDSDDLTGLLRVVLANRTVLDGMDSGWNRVVSQLIDRVGYLFQSNTRWGSRRNIAAHYDLSNEFFELWLDERMMYSSAVYPDPTMSLDEASVAKLERVATLLDLQPGDHVLEIGSGWGGLAIYLARTRNVRVTTTTISRAQYREAEKRIAQAGLEERITLLSEDYRDLQGRFDEVVSLEMVEAVGDAFLDGYFARVDRLLKPGGRFVMQAITIRDEQYHKSLREVDFIKKHIFPGGFIPSVGRLVEAAVRTGSLNLYEQHDIGQDYARTLSEWSRRFRAVEPELNGLGFDREFCRLWQFYFGYCRAGFLEQAISDKHLVFVNSQSTAGS